MKPACVKCGLFFQPKKNGVTLEEGRPVGRADAIEVEWLPYKLWRADLLECTGCGVQIITGYAYLPMSEHYKPDYNQWKERFPPIVFIKDC